jgi:Icc-related predicted phosphoesterase
MRSEDQVRILFVSDLHGSDVCFRKMLNAASVYGVDDLMIGGDICGKFLVPIQMESTTTGHAELWEENFTFASLGEIEAFERRVAESGAYAIRCDEDRYVELRGDQSKVEAAFAAAASERVRTWVDLAEERLRATGKKLYITAGNDDPWEVESILTQSGLESVIHPDRKVVQLRDGTELLTLGYANQTPWHCPRDKSEEELAAEIDRLAADVEDLSTAVFSLHCPPNQSSLDNGPRLDDQLRPKMGMSGPDVQPVGSTAVRAAIERYQPALSLHGHIHESRGAVKLGRTLAINPGSEYGEGVLRGVVVEWDGPGREIAYQLTAG